MGLLTLGRREHTDPAKPYHVHENRNSSKERWAMRGKLQEMGQSKERPAAEENQTKGTGREE